MIAPACRHESVKRHGHDPYGNQRYRCRLCGATWIKKAPQPLGDMRIDRRKAVLALRMLLEGNSLRSVERIVGIAHATVLSLLETVGRRAVAYWETEMNSLPVMDVEVDEIWGFIGCKEKTRKRNGYGEEFGDCYTFTAIERTTKLLVTYHVGKRTPTDTRVFSERLRRATNGRFQLTTDGYPAYETAIPAAFQGQVDFAQLSKIYATVPGEEHRYSPPQIVDLTMHSVCGYPLPEFVCTSHVERGNLSIRMACRRMTRLTNAHSKKWENHEYHLALWFLWYNFCRVHMTLRTTPAVAAGITDHVWTIEEFLEELAATNC